MCKKLLKECQPLNNKPKLRFKDKNGNAYPEWEEKAMEQFGTFLKGNNLSKADLTPNGYPCILYGELYTKYSEITEKIHSYTARLEANQTIGNMNDVLIPSSGETAIDISTATCLLVNDVLLGGDLNVFRPKEQDGRFISYELNHKKRRKIASIAQGATVVHLYPNFLKKLKITLPCIDEQEKIAEFLSKVDELINECEGEVKDLEEQKKGLMQKIFSQQIRFKDFNNNPYPDWEETKLEEIYNFKYGLYNNNPDNGGQYPVYGANGVIGGYTEYNAENSVIIGHMGAYAGSVLFEKNKHFVTYNGTITTPKDINKLNSRYGYFLLLNLNIRKICDGSGQPFLSYDTLNRIKAKASKNIEEQEKIAKVLSKMDELIEEKKALLSDWQQFKKGLLQQMFV